MKVDKIVEVKVPYPVKVPIKIPYPVIVKQHVKAVPVHKFPVHSSEHVHESHHGHGGGHGGNGGGHGGHGGHGGGHGGEHGGHHEQIDFGNGGHGKSLIQTNDFDQNFSGAFY